jgi:CheY-like chemotaxis protein
MTFVIALLPGFPQDWFVRGILPEQVDVFRGHPPNFLEGQNMNMPSAVSTISGAAATQNCQWVQSENRSAKQSACPDTGRPATIPIIGRPSSTQRAALTEGGSTQMKQSPPNILAVIPDDGMLQAIRHAISALGAKTIKASSLREARDILGHSAISLVICSAHLRDGTFHELFPAVHRKGVGMVVACTGACSPGARIDALELGILDYIAYPLPAEELQWVVQNALARGLRGKTIAAAMR